MSFNLGTNLFSVFFMFHFVVNIFVIMFLSLSEMNQGSEQSSLFSSKIN